LSCQNNPKINNKITETIQNKYSNNFEIKTIEPGYLLKVKNRFGNGENKTNNYFLYKTGTPNSEFQSIKIPVRSIIALSTTHCAFISTLGKIETIKGISGTNYVYHKKIREKIEQGEILEVGYEKQINYERIISLNPDIVFAYAVDNNSIAVYQKLIDIGIPIIYVGDFLETTPLGRSEWIKFFACFFDDLYLATTYFDSICQNYNKLTEKILQEKINKPRVLVSLPWKGTWWIPGGNSFFANFISEAGGNYIYSNNNSSESVPHSIEEIFDSANDIDIWLNPNEYTTKSQICGTDQRLTKFLPLKNSQIFNNNKRISKTGGNDFWESGIVHPDIILNDLYTIFYNKNLKYSDLYYYQEVK
jgi:iron complex transport system substrate-binding protein